MTKALQIKPKVLWFLTMAYAMVLIFANIFDARLVQVGGVLTDAGTVIFPLTFLLADVMTEVYGYKHTRRAIWCGLLFSLLFVAYGQLITHLPSPDFATQNALFDTMFKINERVILASFLSYICAEPLNSVLIAKLKMKLAGRYMAGRFVFSTVIASAVDSTIFTFLAFYGTLRQDHLWQLILTMWLIKVAIEILGLPLSVWLSNKLKRVEALDVYDKDTRFNIFSLNVTYATENNAFQDKLNP